MQQRSIIVVGAGITGLWQALTLARRGHRVRLIEQSAEPFAQAASRFAGAMLGPYCETEAAAPVIRDLGLTSMTLWRDTFPGTILDGTLVLAAARDKSEIDRFARLTEGHQSLDETGIGRLEPDLAGRFATGLFYRGEGHVPTVEAMRFLLDEIKRAGVAVAFGTPWTGPASPDETVIDCRGLGAAAELPDLRGVRGERFVVRSAEVKLHRPVRLLHPRRAIYVVPWGDGLHMIGSTVIERGDDGPVTVRSALELLGMAYTLHPAFAEAEIVEMGAGVRPAFADNVPKVRVAGRTIHVNGLFRHGFLLAPVLSVLVADYLETGAIDNRVFEVGAGSPRRPRDANEH
jgi:glycine oxidase